MAQQDLSLPSKVLKALFPDTLLLQLAKEAQVVKRKREFQIAPFFWTIVLGFGTGALRKIAEFRREYNARTGSTLAPSSFYDRFTPHLTEFLKACLLHAFERLRPVEMGLKGTLANFKDLIVVDATVLRIHHFLKDKYPATRTNHTKAALKLHMEMSLSTQTPVAVRVAGERTNDKKLLKIGPWVKGKLLLADLGYYKFKSFQKIDENGGFFVSRMKTNGNPLIISNNIPTRGRSVGIVGRRLQEVVEKLQREVVDVNVELSFYNRKYRGKQRKVTTIFRMVGIRWEGEMRFYLTNVPTESLSAKEIAQTYRCRWEIELIFKELKSQYRLDHLDTRKEHIINAMIYSALLTLIANRALYKELLRREHLTQRDVPILRWGKLFTAIAPIVISEIMGQYAKNTGDSLWETILHEALDPNRSRILIRCMWGGES